ncbi:MAG: hypothetical protein M1835_000888 [Candelina submexicana]|nr:MAG: hypothetical protein M1835_000888 [Candelina submexicana]
MPSNDGRRKRRSHGSRRRRKEEPRVTARCNGAPGLSPIPEIMVTPCPEKDSQSGKHNKVHDTALPIDINHLAPPPLSPFRCKETISRSLQVAAKTLESKRGSEKGSNKALYPPYAVVNLTKIPPRLGVRFEEEVPSQGRVLASSEDISRSSNQRQDAGPVQDIRLEKGGLWHSMSKNAWRRHCKKLQSQGLATKKSTGASVGECFSGGVEPLARLPSGVVRSELPQTTTQGGSNISIEARPNKITVTHIEQLARSMQRLHSSSPLGGHRQWGSRTDKSRKWPKGEQTSTIDLSTREGFPAIISRGNARKALYMPLQSGQDMTFSPTSQKDSFTMQQTVRQRDFATSLNAACDLAPERPQRKSPPQIHTSTFAQDFTGDYLHQAVEEDMSRYTIPELQSYSCSALPVSPEESLRMNSIIGSSGSHRGRAKQDLKQKGSTSPDHYSTDPGSLTTGTSPKVVDTVATPTSCLTSRDVNRGPANLRRNKIMVSKAPRGKWVTPAPTMIKPSEETTPNIAPTTPDPMAEAAKPKIIVNLPSAPVPSQGPSAVRPSCEPDTTLMKVAQGSLPLQTSLVMEPSDKQAKSPATVAKSSPFPQNPIVEGGFDKRDNTSITIAQQTLPLQALSTMEVSNDNDASSMAVAQRSEAPLQDVASVASVRVDQATKVDSQQVQEVTVPEIKKASSTHPNPAIHESEQPKAKRNSNWPSKQSMKGISGRAHPGSNDWGSATPSQYENDKANSSMDEGRIEQHYEHQLAGWDGKWAPPPIEWDARPAFNSTDKHKKQQLEDWMATVVANGTKIVDPNQASFADGTAHTAITAEGELALVIPPEPEEAPLDREDPETVANRMQTAESSALKYSNRALVHEKDKKRRNREYAIADAELRANYVAPPNPHAPKAKIYLRPASMADFKQIAELYKYYIQNTVHVPEREVSSETTLRYRYEAIRGRGFPWLVAVEPIMIQRRRYEKIVGFGHIDDYSDSKSSYRYTAELEFYVHHQHLRLGIGKCLMDKLMCCLDPTYMPRGGYIFDAGEDDNKYREGGMRVISKVLINFPFDHKDDKTVKWLGDWMAQWEFKQMGTLEGIGFKLDKQ